MTIKPFYPPGHYSSPIVDPAQVRDHMAAVPHIGPHDIPGIQVPLKKMRSMWSSALNHVKGAEFHQHAGNRRFYLGGPFPFGDALFLRLMMFLHKPRNIIEVGSGFSTACMLDVADEVGLNDIEITCVEPFPARLFSLLRPEDNVRVTIHQIPVQQFNLNMIKQLDENDILFIDSTHVLKTGSDVNFVLFNILPLVKPGVLVHFHDVPFPFEYPSKWVIEDNFSWNEAYALRAFLMYNSYFSIHFWGSAFRREYRNELATEYPPLLANNPGTSIWIRRH